MSNNKQTQEVEDGGLPGVLQVMEGMPPHEHEPAEPDRPRGLLRAFGKVFLYLDRVIGRFVPEALNPLHHTGAIAVVSFLVATVTGIVLLIWYRPSVNMAYASVEAMSASPYTAGLLRSLHRYSSDATVFFAIVHAMRVFSERRFGGARWLAWVTGVLMMSILWFIGWTGYWLVWDLRAQSVAVGTAKLVDLLPIFADPLGRSFLTDEGVNSLLFFVVFFFHMLVPLAMGVVAWIHITRLARARFLTERPMTVWILGFLLLLSLVYPATSADPARMTAIPQGLTIDWWYLLPLAFTDRFEPGVLWAGFLLGGVVLFSMPWWLAGRRPQPASVVASRCNECRKCFQGCPYEAIEMITRTDGNEKYLTQANVRESKCVSCGICAGSCDTAGIGLQGFGSIEQRRRIEGWLHEAAEAGENVHLAFSCAEAAGGALDIDTRTGVCEELPGYRVLTVPCAGWVQPLLVERALRHGASGVLIVSCEPGSCQYREGAQWTLDRMEGRRLPALRTEKIEPGLVTLLALDRTRKKDLVRQARAVREGSAPERTEAPAAALRPVSIAAACILAVVMAAFMGLVSDFGYAAPRLESSELVVSFSHPGAASDQCRTRSEEELAALPVHMRKAEVCDRGRSPVRFAVLVDGQKVVEKSVTPSGIWEDGNSVVVERIPVEPGAREVSIAIGDTADADEWPHRDTRSIEFTTDSKRVITFDRLTGFR